MNEQSLSELRMPADAKYILPIRLFIAGVAVRLDFPAETIEDIKMATAEACSILLGGVREVSKLLCVTKEIDKGMEITLTIEGEKDPSQVDDISVAVLQAMSDECFISYKKSSVESIKVVFNN